MSTPTLRVSLGPRNYDIRSAGSSPNGVGGFLRECRPTESKVFVVTDSHVRPHADTVCESLREAGFDILRADIPAGEASKCLAQASTLYDRLAEWPADRHTLLVAIGGGVVGDLTGFVAATYARGLALFMVPTSLLAMVDSSVGGKVGVNHPLGKNLIGAFHQPVGVWIDPAFLGTLPEREYRSGLAEVVKYAVIMDELFLPILESNLDRILARDHAILIDLVTRCCRLKARVVEKDEREETGLRMILNYGHTFAHVFESVGGYGAWLHGEAVAAGMVCASRLAESLGMIPAEVTARQVALLEAFGLPTAPKPEWPIDALIDGMYRDKKAKAGKLRFILPTRLGEVTLVEDVNEANVRDVLAPA